MRRLALLCVLLGACSSSSFELSATVQSLDGPDLELTYQGQPVTRRANGDGSTTWTVEESFGGYDDRAGQVRDVVVSRAGVELTRIHLTSSFCHPADKAGDPKAESYEVLLHGDGRFCLSLQKCVFSNAVSTIPMLCN